MEAPSSPPQQQQIITTTELTVVEQTLSDSNSDASSLVSGQSGSINENNQIIMVNGRNIVNNSGAGKIGHEIHVFDGNDRVKQNYQNNNRPPPPPRPPKSVSDPHLFAAQNKPAQAPPPACEPFCLKLGFANSATGRYLTAEKFNNRLNVTGPSLKARQQWTLECPDLTTDVVYLKSASGFYLAANVKGLVSCDSAERSPETQFVIEFERAASPDIDDDFPDNDVSSTSDSNKSSPSPPSSFTVGRWAIRNVLSGAYLGVWSQQKKTKLQDEQLDSVQCRIDRTNLVTDSELWHAQLSATPMVHLKNFGRGNRYVHLNKDGDAFVCNDVVPWGKRSILLLEFYEGKYAIRSAANNKYLHRDGALVPCLSRDTLFSLEFKTCVGLQQLNGVVFRDLTGACLCASGVGMLRSSIRKAITKDELFAITESHPQVTLTNVANGKYVSIKQGMDLSANQPPLEPDPDSPPSFVPYSNSEIFQIEIDRSPKTNYWTVLAPTNKLWQINASGAKSTGVTACGEDRLAPDAQFEALWHETDGSVSLKAVMNGCYVKANPSGALQVTTPNPQAITDREKFFVDIINRPLTVFRGSFGFIGLLTANNTPSSKGISLRLDCSRVTHDVFELVQRGPGTYSIKAVNGKYWRVVDGDLSLAADCDDLAAASWFRFEFRRSGRATIRHVQNPSGAGLLYLSGEQSGILSAKCREINDNSLWEM